MRASPKKLGDVRIFIKKSIMKIKYSNLVFTPKEINEEHHTIRAVFSTSDVDRHGEVVDQKSWLLDDFMKNPVVLFGHDHSQPPVGMITGLGYNSDGNLEGEVKFAATEYPFAKVIWNLYKGGFMKAFSVGFSSGKVDIVDDQVILKENTLYEISTVSVPANAMALAKSKGLNVEPLETKLAAELAKSLNVSLKEETGEFKEEEEAPEEIVEDTVAQEEKCADCGENAKGCPCKEPKKEAPVEETPGEEAAATEAEATEVAEEEEPAEEAPVEEKAIETDEEKASIGDVIDEQEVWEKKHENFGRIDDLFYAFYRTYFDEETGVDEFEKLLAEFIDLLGDVDKAKVLFKEVSADNVQKYLDMIVEKEGRVLSKANRNKIASAVEALQALLDADDKDKSVVRDNTTDHFIKVETPAVRISVPAKGANKAKLINKAVRALLAEKRKN